MYVCMYPHRLYAYFNECSSNRVLIRLGLDTSIVCMCMYVCMYVCMYTLMSGGPIGYWFD